MLSSAAVLVVFAYGAVIYCAHLVNNHVRRRNKSQDCGKPQSLEQESFLGIRMLYESYKSLRDWRYLELSASRFAECAKTFAFKQLGSPGILTIEPANVKAILSTQFQDFGVGQRRADAFEPLIGHGIFTADGIAWETARRLIKPCFARGQLDDLSMIEPHFQALVANLPADGVPVDLQQLFQALTLDVSTEFLFGESTSVLTSSDSATAGKSFANAFDRAQKAVIRAYAIGSVAWLDPSSHFGDDRDTVHNFMSRYVEKALQTSAVQSKACDSKYSFVDEFANQTSDPKLIVGGLLNTLLAGRDTTASLLSNLFFVLSRQPRIWRKLGQEVRETAPNLTSCPTMEDLKSLKYLKACLNESLRLHSPIPRNSRTAVRDTTLPTGGGPDGSDSIFVAKGTQVGYHIYSMHRRKDVFGEDADEFVPERWIDKGLRPGWAYLPFNGGPRICIGQQFALNLASYVVFRLVQTLDSVESCGQAQWREGLGITCSTGDGTWVRCRRQTVS